MHFTNLNDYTKAVSSYLSGYWPIKPSPFSMFTYFQFPKKDKLNFIKKIILTDRSSFLVEQKLAILEAIEKAFRLAKSSATSKIKESITYLKNALTESLYLKKNNFLKNRKKAHLA